MRFQFIFVFILLLLNRCTKPEGNLANPIELSLPGKKVLFIYGGWEGHKPAETMELYVPWLEDIGAEVIVSNTLDTYLDTALMRSADLIIQTWTLGSITSEQLNGLLNAVEHGTGFAGWHGGIVDAFRGKPEYFFMTGGQFVAHPGDLVDHTVRVTKPNDPIMVGVEDFMVHTEQYFMHVDPSIEILANTVFTGAHIPWIEGIEMPVIWKKTFGAGRVFVNAIGHNLEDHTIPEFETTLKRGIVWACR